MRPVPPRGPRRWPMGRAWVEVGSAVGLAACLLLAGCRGTGAGGAAEHPAATTPPPDWRNTSYPITCDGVVPGGFRAPLVNGAARVPADVGDTPYYDSFDVRFEASTSGDVDGDGVPDTVVLLQCS